MKQSIIGILTLLIAMMMWIQRPVVKAYDYRDCEYFILNHLSNTHYTECLKNPYNYAHYFVYYNVTFFSDSSSISSQSIRRGQNASAPLSPVKVGHTFNGWDKGFTNVQSNLSVNAVWIRSQKVTFLDYNGTVLKEQFVEQGQSATPPAVQARSGYEFSGWNASYTNVMQDVSVMATYQAIVYQVTFLDDAGNVYQTLTTTYNGSVQPPTPPVVTGKTFTQWSATTNQIQSNMTVQAMYETNRYTVRFLDESNVVKEQLVNHGDDATPPTMNKEGHVFAGWSAPYADVSSSIDLTAQWTKELFDVYFYLPSGTLLSHQSIEYMEAATPPSYSPVEGMEFVSWDESFTEITATTHLHPIEQVAQYIVYFMDGDTLLTQETVQHGMPCTEFTPVKTGHTFVSWSQSCAEVKENLTLHATFDPHQFTVLFYDFLGAVIKEERVSYGTSATAPDTNFPNYQFVEWNNSFDAVTEDISVRPLGQLRTYQAVFKNYEGTTLCTRIVAFNDVVDCPAPVRVGHRFTGWSDSLIIQADITLFAQYEVLLFQVDFYVDNVLAKSELVKYNFDATPPPINLNDFEFIRWDGSFQKVTQAQRVDAVLRRKEYVVVFKVDDTTIKEMSVAHGQDAVAPAVVIKKGHQFVGWLEDYTNITTHRAIHAQFDPLSYEVTFVVQGSPYETLTVPYMSDVTPPIVDVEGHELIGWRGEMNGIEQDTSIYAILRPKTYLVTFLDNEEVIHEEEVAHGESASAPDNGPWDQSFDVVIKSMTIQRLASNEIETTSQEVFDSQPTSNAGSVITPVLSISQDTYRYTFDLNLAEFELIDVRRGSELLNDVSLMKFQSTNIFRREVRWLEIENPDHQPITFYLRNFQTLETMEVIPQLQAEPMMQFPQQLWLSIVSFFRRLIS